MSKIIWSHVIHFTHLLELVEPHLFYIPPLAVHKHISLLPPLPAFVTIWAIGNTQRKISVTKNVKDEESKVKYGNLYNHQIPLSGLSLCYYHISK